MLKSINGWTFPGEMPLAEAARLARQAGFEAFEVTLNATGELTPATDEAACRRLGDQVRAAGLQVASLASGLSWDTHYTHSDAAVRKAACELTIACLDRARWIGAEAILVVPGVVWRPRTSPALVCPYEEAIRHAYHALRDLAPEAERRGVTIAIENVWNGFLTSPVELRDFIDRINSSWVCVYLDTGNVLRYGVPHDWIDTLGQRIARVHLKDLRSGAGKDAAAPLGDGDIDWPAAMAALRRIGYHGPLTYEGAGDPADISRRVDTILAKL